jgi:hypothetical protein
VLQTSPFVLSATLKGSPYIRTFQPPPQGPVIVRIISPPKDTTGLSGLADVLIGSLGLTGAIVLAAVVMGAMMAAVMFWVRSRSA